MKTIAFLLHNNFEQAEYEEVNNKLKDKGYKTLLITTNDDKEVQAMNQDVNKGDTFTADIFAKEANTDEYDALVLPGGTVNADTIRGNEQAHSIIKAINDNGGQFTVETLQGNDLTLKLWEGSVYVIDAKGNKAKVVIADVDTSNGVIHAIDSVVLPE